MNNKIKIFIAIIAIILVVIICIIAFNKKDNTDEVNSNTVENVVNTVLENEVVNDIIDENTAVKNVAQNITETQILETADFSNSVYEDDSDVGTIDKKQEAIDLVKKQWGEDNTVTFSCDSITSDGIYIIAVTSKERAVVLNYFKVNLTDKTVTLDY